MNKQKVKVRLKDDTTATLLLSKQEKRELEQELSGFKMYYQAYETTEGERICDAEIVSKIGEYDYSRAHHNTHKKEKQARK